MPVSRVRVIVPDIGGSFGSKWHLYPEDLVAAALARVSGKPVRWIEDRYEHFVSSVHAREQRTIITLAADRRGIFKAFEAGPSRTRERTSTPRVPRRRRTLSTSHPAPTVCRPSTPLLPQRSPTRRRTALIAASGRKRRSSPSSGDGSACTETQCRPGGTAASQSPHTGRATVQDPYPSGAQLWGLRAVSQPCS